MAFGMNGVFAQYERLKFRERSVNGKIARAKAGIQPSRALSPYGYIVVNTAHVMDGLYPKEMLGKYVLVEKEAKVARQIFEWCASGRSLNSIATQLDEDGVVPPKGGGHWIRGTIRFMVANPVYKGKPQWRRYTQIQDESRLDRGLSATVNKKRDEADWVPLEAPAIVEDELWEQANQRLTANLPGPSSNCYLLRGLLVCPSCGRRMSGSTIGGSHYYKRNEEGAPSRARYRCNANRNPDKIRRCEHTFHYRADLLEEAVLKLFLDMVRHPANLRKYVETRREKKAAAKGPNKRKELEGQLTNLRKRQETLIEAQLRASEAGVSSAPYETKLRATESEMEEITRELSELEVPQDSGSMEKLIEEMIAVGEMVGEFYDEPRISNLEKNRNLAMVIEKVIIVNPKEYQVEIEFKKR